MSAGSGELACYGNATEKDNIMGQGMTVAFANLEPFLRIVKRFGKNVIPKQYQDKGNVWTPVVSLDG